MGVPEEAIVPYFQPTELSLLLKLSKSRSKCIGPIGAIRRQGKKENIREQIRQKIVAFEGQAKPSKINPVLKWWSKYISMFIAKTASRNVVYKATKLAESIFERQSEMLMPKEDLTTTSSVTYEEYLEDLGYNADLYVFNDETFEGCSSSYECIQRRREQ